MRGDEVAGAPSACIHLFENIKRQCDHRLRLSSDQTQLIVRSSLIPGSTAMPTYICTVAPNRFSDTQKSAVVDALTRIHSEEGKAPAYLVHVLFDEVSPSNRFINRRQVSADDIWIHGHIRAGRTDEQKAAMATRMTAECAKAFGVEDSFVWVYISDLAKAAEFGSLLPAPGEQAEWYASIPTSVKARYGLDA